MKNNLLLILSVISAVCFLSCDKEDISLKQADNFIKYYTNFTEFTASDVEVIANSGYAILGTAETADSGTQICLMRTDEYGNIIDVPKLYGRIDNDIAYCLKVLDNGGFAILGTSVDPVTQVTEGYFICTDNNGEPKFVRELEAPGNMEVRHFDIDDQGRFFITGYFDVIDKGKQVLIIALNSNGTNYWPNFRDIGVQGDEEGNHLQIMETDSIVITGRARNSISGSSVYQGFILLVNETGLQIDWIDVAYTGKESEGKCVRILDKNNCMVLSTVKSSAGSTISLAKVNLPLRNVMWQESYSTVGSDVAQTFIFDGDLMYLLGTTGVTAANSAITMITANDTGDQVERSDFGLGTELSGVDFSITPDGGLIIVGTNENPEDNNTSVALIKTFNKAF